MSFKRVPLGELLDGKGYIRGPFGSALKRADMHESGIPVYEQQHAIYGHRDFRYFIQDDKFQKLNRFQVQSNDLIISCSGTVGRISIIKESDPQGIISQALLILRVDSQKLLPDFLYYFLTSPVGKRELLNASQGAVQQNIAPRAVVEKIEVPLPDMSIQKLIVNQLKNLDKKVWVNTTINETLEEMAQAIFKSWFVDFDPVKTKMNGEQPEGMDAATASLFPEKLVESELGLIPEGWQIATLKSLSEKISKGTTPSKKDLAAAEDEASIRFIKVKDINDQGEILRDSLEIIPDSIHVGKLKRSILETNDILFSIAGTIGRVATVDQDLNNVNTNQAVAFVRLKDKKRYLPLVYMALRENRLQQKALASIVQGVQANLSLTNVGEMEVVIPSDEVLELWNKQYSSMFKMIKSNFAQSRELSTLRDTLLPKLLSGEIELGETEEMAEVN